MPTEADLRQALRDCFDPVSRRDILNLNLVRSAALFPDPDAPGATIPGVPARFLARLHLTEPSPDEAHIATLRALIENRLLGLPWISRVEIRTSPNPLPILS